MPRWIEIHEGIVITVDNVVPETIRRLQSGSVLLHLGSKHGGSKGEDES